MNYVLQRGVIVASLVTGISCDHKWTEARLTVVQLDKRPGLPAMTIEVPEELAEPIDTAPPRPSRAPRSRAAPDKPNHHWLAGGERQAFASGEDVLAQVHVMPAHVEPECDGDWWIVDRGERPSWRCSIGHLLLVRIPHPNGAIHCWSDWFAFGELGPAQEAFTQAIDASCSTLAFE